MLNSSLCPNWCEWFWRWPWERQMKQSFCSPNRLSFRWPQHGKPARVELPWGRTPGARVLLLQMSGRCAELVCLFKSIGRSKCAVGHCSRKQDGMFESQTQPVLRLYTHRLAWRFTVITLAAGSAGNQPACEEPYRECQTGLRSQALLENVKPRMHFFVKDLRLRWSLVFSSYGTFRLLVAHVFNLIKNTINANWLLWIVYVCYLNKF